jgi:hypothetical protein
MQTTDLIWTKYNSIKKGSYYVLLIYLGEKDGKTISLLADNVPQEEINILRSELNTLKTLPLEQIIQFIKDNMPRAATKAFRPYDTTRLVILNTMPLKPLNQ